MDAPDRPATARIHPLGAVLAAVGAFVGAFAVNGLVAPLPKPAAGGTCGPGDGSEAAVRAIVDPHSIGAGPRPPASQRSALANWKAFVHDCQTAADQRAAVVAGLLVLAVALLAVGLVLVRRRWAATAPVPLGDPLVSPPVAGDGWPAAAAPAWAPAPVDPRLAPVGAPYVPPPPPPAGWAVPPPPPMPSPWSGGGPPSVAPPPPPASPPPASPPPPPAPPPA